MVGSATQASENARHHSTARALATRFRLAGVARIEISAEVSPELAQSLVLSVGTNADSDVRQFLASLRRYISRPIVICNDYEVPGAAVALGVASIHPLT